MSSRSISLTERLLLGNRRRGRHRNDPLADSRASQDRHTSRTPRHKPLHLLLEMVLLASIVFVFWPAPFGGRLGIVVVAGHSMEPTYALEDVVVTWKQPVDAGDVALFTVTNEAGQKGSVIHRLAGRDTGGWITQGDNNGWLDPWVVPDDQILGQPLFALHGAGRLLEIYRSPMAVGVLFGAAVLFWLWPEPDDQPRTLKRTRVPRHAAPRVRSRAPALTGLLYRALSL